MGRGKYHKLTTPPRKLPPYNEDKVKMKGNFSVRKYEVDKVRESK